MFRPIVHPVLSLALAWVAGRALPAGDAVLVMLGCAGLLLVASRCDRAARGRFVVAHALLFVGALVWPPPSVPGCEEKAGAFIATVQRVEPVSTGVRQPVEILITAERSHDGQPWRRASVSTTAYLDDAPTVLPGDRIQFRGETIGPVDTLNPSDFDVATYRRNHGWSCRVRVTSGHAHRRRGRGVATWIAQLRRMSYRGLEGVEEPSRSILRAIALGARSEFPTDIRDRWSRAGLAHLLAISGLHVTLVFILTYSGVGALSWTLARAGVEVLGWRRVAGALGASVSFAYCVWAGSPASAVRAASMLILLTLCRVLAEAMHPLQALALVASLMIGVEPQALSDVGFWLSVSAVGALVSAPKRTSTEPKASGWSRRLLDLGESLIAPAIATAPICAAVFRSIAWASPLANVIALPLGTFALTPLALIAAPLSMVGLHGPPIWAASFVVEGLDRLATLAANVESPSSSHGTLWVLTLSVLAILSASVGPKLRWALRGVVIGALLVGSSSCGPGSPELHITHIAVGQGDATLIRFPDGQAWLVDGGGRVGPGRFDPGRAHVVPALLDAGVFRLDAVVATHGDADHVRGLHAVLDRMEVGELIWNGRAEDNEGMRALLADAESRGIPIHAVGRDESRQIGPAVVRLWSWPDAPNDNDASVVSLVRYGCFRALLPGDIGAEREVRLVDELEPVSLLLAPHHGSDSSSSEAFVAKTQPTVVVVSVGRDNRYGLPKEEVLTRYERRGAQLYRLDRSGQVRVVSDGRSSRVWSWRDRQFGLARTCDIRQP